MDDLELALKACVARYEEAVSRMVARLRPGDGILGMGRDPRRDPCHMEFYEAVGQAVTQSLQAGLEAGGADRAVRFLLSMSQGDRHTLARPMMEAAQGHALPLIPLLEKSQAAELVRWYAGQYPKRRRLPIQDKVLAALEKQALR